MRDIEEIAKEIVDAAVKVHKELGPGLLESAYQACLAYELEERGIKVACEVACPVIYRNCQIDTGFRLDMVVEDCIIIENKATESLLPIHEAQLMTYLKLKGYWLGFLINWNSLLIKNGIHRKVSGLKPLKIT